MPSLVVHFAVACLLAVLFLDDAFSTRAVAVVVAATAVPDVDSFVGLVVPNAHRAALHNIFVPLLLGAALVYDLRVREESVLRERFGPTAGRVAAVAVLSVAFAATGLDLVTNGVNLFYPLHDQFYTFSGRAVLSSRHGFVQTFVQSSPPHSSVSSTQNTHYATPVAPTYPGAEPAGGAPVERVAPIVQSGWQLWLVLFGYGALVYALWTREGPALRSRFGRSTGLLLAVAVVLLTSAALGFVLVMNGTYLLLLLHDQFYAVHGHGAESSVRGFAQFQSPHSAAAAASGSHHAAADPAASKPVNRVAPIFDHGWELWLSFLGYGALAHRLVAARLASRSD